MIVDEGIPPHIDIGGCKTEKTVRKGCGTNTNELQSIESKDSSYLLSVVVVRVRWTMGNVEGCRWRMI